MTHSTPERRRTKPAKPYSDFPLFAHGSGRWCKKIRGRFHYFGPWSDPNAALQRYLDQRDDLHAGRKPRVDKDGLQVAALCNRFLTTKKRRIDTGELVQRTFDDYYRTCERLVSYFGRERFIEDLTADDFDGLRANIAAALGPAALAVEITRVRIVMKYAYDQGLIEHPVRYGQCFGKPSRRVIRQRRNEVGERMFEAADLHKILAAAKPPMKAMILLGINCAYGPADVGRLQAGILDLKTGWANYPRPKTGIRRRCKLWPETIAAINEATAKRPKTDEIGPPSLVFRNTSAV